MTRLTPCFLVLLRIAIGWHFFFEGVGKLPPDSWPVRALKGGPPISAGQQVKKEPFSSEVYLRESAGPLAPWFRDLAGDTVLERVQLPQSATPTALPPALEADWDGYFQRFKHNYQPTEAPLFYFTLWLPGPNTVLPAATWYPASSAVVPSQAGLIDDTFRTHKAQLAEWLAHGVKVVKLEIPGGPSVDVERTTPQRVQAYRDQVEKVRRIQDQEMSTFGPDVNARLRAAKADANRMRAELRKDLDDRTLDMKKALHACLTTEQRLKPLEDRYNVTTWEVNIVPPTDPIQAGWADMSRLQWADWSTRWGLFFVGVCLLLGLFTRTACVGGAAFLLLFYLAMPPLPGLPDNPRAEGSYLLINKNTIEMLALLALATTASGKWVGLDGLVQFLNPFRSKARPRRHEPVAQDGSAPPPPPDPSPMLVPSNGAVAVPLTPEHQHTSEAKELSHGD